MRHRMLVGCALLGASAMACGGARGQAPRIETEPPVAVSAGEGGAGNVEEGEWAPRGQASQSRQQREFYGEVASELGLDQWHGSAGQQAPRGEAMGGGGRAGGEGLSCAQVLSAHEAATVVSGKLDFASSGLLVLSVPGQGAVKLHVDEDTCAVQTGQELLPASLVEGTEVRASYVTKDGLPTARVVRAEPERPQR